MSKNMKITLGVVLAVVLLLVIFFISSYNGLVSKQATVEEKWSNIEVVLQKRADNIPQLVEIVKDYTEYEQSTLTAVTEARTAYQNANNINDKIETYEQMESATRVWVNAVSEAYPDLEAIDQFKALSDTVISNEDEISYTRKLYNEAVKEYNTSIKKFPRNIVAGMFGFEDFEFFQMADYANEIPSGSIN